VPGQLLLGVGNVLAGQRKGVSVAKVYRQCSARFPRSETRHGHVPSGADTTPLPQAMSLLLGAVEGARVSAAARDLFSLSLPWMWKLSSCRAKDSRLLLRLMLWMLLSESSPRAGSGLDEADALCEWSSWMLSSTHGRGREVVAIPLIKPQLERPEISQDYPRVFSHERPGTWETGGSNAISRIIKTRLASARNEGCLIPRLDGCCTPRQYQKKKTLNDAG